MKIFGTLMSGCVFSLICAWVLLSSKDHILADSSAGIVLVSVLGGTFVTMLVAQFTFPIRK